MWSDEVHIGTLFNINQSFPPASKIMEALLQLKPFKFSVSVYFLMKLFDSFLNFFLNTSRNVCQSWRSGCFPTLARM